MMAAGGLGAIILTPAFALSYFSAYGADSESPPAWLAALENPLAQAGLLVAGSPAVYDRYGIAYLAMWIIGSAGLAGVVRRQWSRLTPSIRGAWGVVLAFLAVIAVGILGDYALPSDLAGMIGFFLTLIGFLGAAIAFAFAGIALRRGLGTRPPVAWAVGLLGVVSVVGGMALVGHIPSGPGLGFAVAAVFAGITGTQGSGRAPDPGDA